MTTDEEALRRRLAEIELHHLREMRKFREKADKWGIAAACILLPTLAISIPFLLRF